MSNNKSFEVGGMKITKLVPQSEIDAFVQSLPDQEKEDIKNVIMALNEQGYISIEEA